MIYLIVFINFLSCVCAAENYNYRISFWGFNIADCKYSIADTTIYNQKAIKLNFNVQTKPMYDFFFKVSNNYSIVVTKDNFRTLYYSKKSYQPKITNDIYTQYIDDTVKYSDSLEISSNEINIFNLLYLISNKYYNKIKSYNIIDNEGKKYNYELKEINPYYFTLKLDQIDKNKLGAIEHTDIFTWAISLPNTENHIYLDDTNNIIKRCEFYKGFLSVKAELIK